MKKVLTYLPLHFTMQVILGILCQYYFNIWQFGFLKIGFLFLVLLLLLLIKQKVLRTLVSFLLFYFVGVSSVYLNNDLNYSNHYSKQVNSQKLSFFKITKVLKPNDYYHKYEAKVIKNDTSVTCGKVLLNIAKNDTLIQHSIDDILIAKPEFQEVSKPSNPFQFNYREFLIKQGIYQQVYLKENEYLVQKGIQNTMIGYSDQFRNRVDVSLKKYNFKPDELAVINALLLGKRVHISKELLEDYANAGAIHILAVSGLHVGIILLILSILLKPLERLKKGRILKTVLIVIFLWMFAFIAGLSASVVRAVTMFTFLAIGMFFNRKNVVLFSLISSLFLLLIFKPMFLFDVGFQMSYLAVFGIVILQPKFYKLWQPKNILFDKLWQLTTVSLAAQIGVLPLSLFYFHQFPGLFILSNLIIVPFLGLILMGGILIVLLALLNILPKFFADVYGLIISLMNNFVSWISNQEDFLFTEISLSFKAMVSIYVVIAFGIYFFTHRKAKSLVYFLFFVLILQGMVLFENYQTENKEEFIVFHKSRNSIFGERNGTAFTIHHDLDPVKVKLVNAIKSYKINEDINVKYQNDISNIYQFKHHKILVVDSLGVYDLDGFKNQIVLLKQSPKINLKRLIKKLEPKQIVADGSNYKSYVQRWKTTSKELKIPFHDTSRNGAFILKN